MFETDLPFPRPGELGLELLLALLFVSMREILVWSFPVADRGLLTAPRTFAALGCKVEGSQSLNIRVLICIINYFVQFFPPFFTIQKLFKGAKEHTFPGVKNDFISGGR